MGNIFKMFDVENEEKLVVKISNIFAQFQDFNHFIKVLFFFFLIVILFFLAC